jgi:pimeloyl-ACP methyl ester carboxylesterase
MNSTAHSLEDAARTDAGDKAKAIAQGLVSNGLCKNLLPIIFLPGVAGSQLYSGDRIVWPTVYTGDRADMALREDGRTPLFEGTQINVGDIFNKLGYNFYGSMIDSLKKNGYKENKNLFLFPYDWRMDNFNQVSALDKLVNQAIAKSGSQKVILLGHSMGGLIARAYAQQHPDKVDSLITMGTPWWGAPKDFYALVNGYTFGNILVNEKFMKILTQNTTAAYQLLPKVPFVTDKFKTNRTIPIQELYDGLRYHGFHLKGFAEFMTCPNTRMMLESYYKTTRNPECEEDTFANTWRLSPTLIQSANAKYPQLIGTKESPVPMPDGVKLYTIIGIGYKTLSSYEIPSDLKASERMLRLISPDGSKEPRPVIFEPRFANGDGTVPQWSAENDAATSKYYVPFMGSESTAHGDLAINSKVQSIVLSILKGKPEDPSKYPPVQNPSLEDLDKKIDFTLR